MTENRVNVRMAEYAVGRSPDILLTVGLGSCLGVALYDSSTKIGGLVHIMLPENTKNKKPFKYADTAIPLLIEKMIEEGAARDKIRAKVVGGAHMFSGIDVSPGLRIGERNIKAVHEILKREKIRVTGSDTGENFGRTMEFHTSDGRVSVRSYKRGSITI